jgi:histidinol-phosphatase
MILETLEKVARLAGDHALAYFRRQRDNATSISVEVKSDGSPVTVADREAEQLAREFLSSQFPHDCIAGEEFGETNPGAKRRWLIDPIDGTKAFVRGVPLWGTLVALCEGDHVLGGVAYFPALGECVVAARGEGCFYNGSRCRVSSIDALHSATVLTTEARLAPAGLALLQAKAQVSRTWGDCYGYLLVATGRAEVMVDTVLNDWDSAALQPIIEEAGGVFTDLRLNRTGFGKSAIACNSALAAHVHACFAVEPFTPTFSLDDIDFGKSNGLIPVVCQDASSSEVLMVAYADREAVEKTMRTGFMHYHSRKRGLWFKGETSGHTQRVTSLHLDCDSDTLLALVVPNGPACHTNAPTCFQGVPTVDSLSALNSTIALRQASPLPGSYTNRLLDNRNLRLKKLGEECAELVVALCDEDRERAAEEGADVLYHMLAALRPLGLGLDDVKRVLKTRAAPKPTK